MAEGAHLFTGVTEAGSKWCAITARPECVPWRAANEESANSSVSLLARPGLLFGEFLEGFSETQRHSSRCAGSLVTHS